MHTTHTYTTSQRFCDSCGVPELDANASRTYNGRTYYWHHGSPIKSLHLSFNGIPIPIPTISNHPLDRDLCPTCYIDTIKALSTQCTTHHGKSL